MRLTTAFNRRLQLPGALVQSVAFTDRGVVIGLRRRRRRMLCPCSRATRARYDISRRRWRHLEFGACQVWLAAGLGLAGRVEQLLAADSAPDAQTVADAFWQACSGGQLRTAMLLLARGADVNGRPRYAGESAIEATARPDTRRGLLVGWLRDNGATGGSKG